MKRGSARQSFSKGRESVIINQMNMGSVSKATLGKPLRDGVECNVGFLECIDTILNWTEQKSLNTNHCLHLSSRHAHDAQLSLIILWGFTGFGPCLAPSCHSLDEEFTVGVMGQAVNHPGTQLLEQHPVADVKDPVVNRQRNTAIALDNFQTGVTSIRWRKWFTETGQSS